jgi:hypothetical protein
MTALSILTMISKIHSPSTIRIIDIIIRHSIHILREVSYMID